MNEPNPPVLRFEPPSAKPASAAAKSAAASMPRPQLEAWRNELEEVIARAAAPGRKVVGKLRSQFEQVAASNEIERPWMVDPRNLPGPMQKIYSRLQRAQRWMEKRIARAEEAFHSSPAGRQLSGEAGKEAHAISAATNKPNSAPGFWTQTFANVQGNLFSATHGKGKLAMNWGFTALGGLMLWDGARLLTAKPAPIVTQNEAGEAVVHKGHRSLGNLAWGVAMLGLGATNLYYSALRNPHGRGL